MVSTINGFFLCPINQHATIYYSWTLFGLHTIAINNNFHHYLPNTNTNILICAEETVICHQNFITEVSVLASTAMGG